MKTLKTYNQFIAESNKGVDEGITDIAGIMSNPIKYKKIKNNAKKYQQTKVQVALNNLDYEKKKAAGKGEGKGDVLKAANAAKNAALKDKSTAISQRMQDLATTDALKKVVTVATTKSNLAAAEIALKAADGEESKQLKIRIKKLSMQAADAQQALKDYESDDGKNDEVELPGEKEQAAKAEKEALDKEKAKKAKEAVEAEVTKAEAAYDKVKDGEDEKAKLQAEVTVKQAQQKKAKLGGNDEAFKSLGDDIAEIAKKISALGEGEPKEPKEGEPTDEDSPKVKEIKDKIKEYKGGIEDLKDKKDKSSKDKVEMLQTALSKAEENLEKLLKNESEKYIPESVSEKFRRLMNNV